MNIPAEIEFVDSDGIDITPTGQFKLRRDIYELIEAIFGKQTPIYDAGTVVILDKIKTSKFFRLVVIGGVVEENYNVKVRDKEWVVDAPDLYEELSENPSEVPADALSMLRTLLVGLIMGETPVTVQRLTVVRTAMPEGRVRARCCELRSGMVVTETLSGEIREDTDLVLEGHAVLYVEPKI